jgi:diguanylate cyclase (GGDEF)-like protein
MNLVRGMRVINPSIIESMRHPPPFSLPLRQFLLRRVGVLVALTTALVMVSFVVFGLLPLAQQVAEEQFDGATARVQSELDAVFAPPRHLLSASRGWLGKQAPDLESAQAFNQVFKPILRAYPTITSVVAGTPEGQGWLLLARGKGRWRNRMTDMPRWGLQRHLLLDEGPDGVVQSQWGEQAYDPRTRPWFMGGMALLDATPAIPASVAGDPVHWTAPYTFFTTGDPGITASTRWRLADGRDFVLGLDLTLRDLSQTTINAQVGAHGLALVLTEDARVLTLPAKPQQLPAEVWLGRVLKPVEQLGLTPVSAALAEWRTREMPHNQVLSFDAEGTRWLASVRPYDLGGQRLWVWVLAPASDFGPGWYRVALALLASLALVMVFAVGLTRAGTTRLAAPLERLSHNSRYIGRLDFQAVRSVDSSVAEIQQLASDQQQMMLTLRSNQQQLDARSQELTQQVTALRATELRLQRQNDMLHTIIDNFPGGVSVVDANLRILAFNRLFQVLLDLPDSLLRQPVLMFEDVIRHNAQRGDYGSAPVENLVAERMALARQFNAHRAERTLPNGTTLEVRGMPLPQGGFVTLYIDVTSAKQHERQLEQLAHFDALTGLPNRVLLADRLRQGMAQALRRGQQLAVAYLDLDGFKQINDTLGHDVGDQVLMILAGRMKQALRDGDTIARIGGDEFVAVLADVDGPQGNASMLKRLLAAVDVPVRLLGQDMLLSASVGVTFFPQSQEVDADQLMRQADQAMYQAKQAGKNCYHVFDTEHDRNLRGQRESLTRIEQALANKEFLLHYQPKVNMRTGEVFGVEALIRWQHGEQGLLPPAMFLPAIEGDALAVDVGEWVIRQALAQLAQWRAMGLAIGISVNVGASQLQQSGFVAFMRSALAEQPDVDPGDLEIEVLETSALQDMAHVCDVMGQCRDLGLHFSLDDFGTGYSSLTYLRRLPVTQLKIDQSFVRDMLTDPEDLSILVGVLDLSASFHRRAIAEGVETVAHGCMLLQLGCEYAQGYGIARPMPAQDIPDWLTRWTPDPLWRGVRVVPHADLPLLFAQVEHRAWLDRLQAFATNERQTPPQLDPRHCHVGQWLAAASQLHQGERHDVQILIGMHQQLHDLATQMCEMKSLGFPAAVQTLWVDVRRAGDALLVQLQSMLPRRED